MEQTVEDNTIVIIVYYIRSCCVQIAFVHHLFQFKVLPFYKLVAYGYSNWSISEMKLQQC